MRDQEGGVGKRTEKDSKERDTLIVGASCYRLNKKPGTREISRDPQG